MKLAGIAIVIPVYNRERELRRTFDSVVAQTYRPIHVVLVDNGSTDGSLALCRELKGAYETDDFRITVVEEAKRGPSAARNRGLACVTEEFVAFLDSDDEYIPEAVSLYMQAFESNSSADIAGCTIRLIPEQGKPYSAKAVFSNRVEPHLFHSTLGTVRYAVRTAVVRAVGGWPEDYMRWEDWDLGIKLLLFTDRIVWVQTPPLVNVYLHADSITGYRYVPNVPDILRAMRKLTKMWSEAILRRKPVCINCCFINKWLWPDFVERKKVRWVLRFIARRWSRRVKTGRCAGSYRWFIDMSLGEVEDRLSSPTDYCADFSI